MEEITLTVGGALVVKKIGDMEAVVFLESDLNGKQGEFYPFINLARLPVGEVEGALGDDPDTQPSWRIATSADDDIINNGDQVELFISLDGEVTSAPSVVDDPTVLLINLPPGVRLGSDFAALFILQLIQDEAVPVSVEQASTPEAKRQLKKVGKSVLTGASKQGVPGATKAQSEAETKEAAEEAAKAAEEAAGALGNGADGADGAGDGGDSTAASSKRVKKAVAWIGSATLLTTLAWGLLKSR